MEAFPFSSAEWHPIRDAADSILDAHFAEDDTLEASLRLEMLDRLADLRARRGDHPVLLETMADYTEADAERAVLYRQAIEIAEAHGLPTLSARVSFVPVLVALGAQAAALDELQACGSEAAGGGEDERKKWVWALERVAYEAASDAHRGALYRRAEEIARAHGLPAFRIRLLHIRFLLDIGRWAAAREESQACASEAAAANEDERTWWAEMFEEANRA